MFGIATEPRGSTMRPIDPYLLLARSTQFVDHVKPINNRYAVSIELKPDATVDGLNKELNGHGTVETVWKVGSHVPFVTGAVSNRGLKILEGSGYIARFELALPFNAQRVPKRTVLNVSRERGAPKSLNRPSGAKVVLGVIDTGCPFAHPILRRRTKKISTRVRALWDQDPAPDFAGYSSTPDNFSYGAEALRDDLDRAMQNAVTHGFVDEIACYDAVGYGEMRFQRSHGSHVLGGCLGFGAPAALPPEAEALNRADVLFVQLPRHLLQVPCRAALARAVLDGVRWIVSKAAKGERHVVINISYGSAAGPHDGSAILEKGLDAIVAAFNAQQGEACKLEIIFAAGNEYNKRLHAQVPAATRQTPSKLTWRVLPGNEMPAFMEIWVPSDWNDVTVNVLPPDEIGAAKVLATPTGGSTFWPSKKACVWAVLNTQWRGADDARMILLRLAPTLTYDGSPSAPAGDWMVTICGNRKGEKAAHAYIAGASGTFGYASRGKQSHFVFSSSTDEENASKGTLNGFACGRETLAVGGFRHDWSGKIVPTDTTSSGPARDERLAHPHYCAREAESAAVPAIKGMGNFASVTFGMNGTSVAASNASRKALQDLLPALTQDPPPTIDGRFGEPVAESIPILLDTQ